MSINIMHRFATVQAASYSGTIDDLQANIPSPMTLSQVRQNDGHISGSFSALQMSGTYNGYLDTAKHIYFTVVASNGSAPFSFTGAVRADGCLAGIFFARLIKADHV